MIQRGFQPRRKLWSDSDSGFRLFAIMDKLESRESVRWKETHIPAGRRTSGPGRVEVNESERGIVPVRPAARQHVSDV